MFAVDAPTKASGAVATARMAAVYTLDMMVVLIRKQQETVEVMRKGMESLIVDYGSERETKHCFLWGQVLRLI